MALAFISKSSASNTGSASLVITKPSSVVSGTLLLASISHTTSTGAVTTPSGWTKIADYVETNNNFRGISSFWKIAGGSEPSDYTFVVTGSNPSLNAGSIEAWSGAHQTSPINASQGGQTSGNPTTSNDSPSVTTTVPNCVIHSAINSNPSSSPAGTSTEPSGMTKRDEVTPSATFHLVTASVAQATAGASGTKTWTVPSGNSEVAYTIALRPVDEDLPALDDSADCALRAPGVLPHLVEEEAIPYDGVYLPGDAPDFDEQAESDASLLPPLPNHSGFAAQMAVDDSEVSQIPAEWLPGQPPDYDAEQESDASQLPPLSTRESEAAAQNAVDDAEVIPVSGAYAPGEPPDYDAEQESDASLLPPLPKEPSEQAALISIGDTETIPTSGAGPVLDAPAYADDESADWDGVLASTWLAGALSASTSGANQIAIDDSEVIPVSGARLPHSAKLGGGFVTTTFTAGGTVRGGS